MSKKTITMLVDDLDDTQIVDGEGETVRFSLDGKNYELDLTNAHANELHSAFDRYVKAARNVGGRQSSSTSSRNVGGRRGATAVDPKTVREWAKANKVELSARSARQAVRRR